MRPLTSLKLALVFVAGLSCAAFAEEVKPFSDAKEINLLILLPPPPANNSPKMQQELAEILSVQVTRTKEMEQRAISDADENIWRFADVINNPNFTKEKLPKFSAFFDRVVETEGAVVDPAKDSWKRTRPHLYSDLVKPIVPVSKSGAYPSGHTTVGTLMGTVLSNMVPEKRADIMKRAWEYGHNRIVGGVHYPTDIEAGRIAGLIVAQTISTHDDFKQEFEAAKTELRAALQL